MTDYSHPRIILREAKEKDPAGIKIKVKKSKKARSLERPVCFRVRDGCPPGFKTRYVPSSEPAYEVAPVVYVNPDGVGQCGPSGALVETLRPETECGAYPLDESVVEKTITKGGSDDEPLVIRIGPTGGFGNGCEEKPVYKINFKDNVMNVTSNIDFLVKKMERSRSMVEREPDAQKYLIKPILKHIPPVTVTVRPNPVGDQVNSTHETSSSSSDERSSTRTRTVPNEYAEKPASRTRTVQAPILTPEQILAYYQQQQQPAQVAPVAAAIQGLTALPGLAAAAPAYAQPSATAYAQPAPAVPNQSGAYQFTPEQIAAAYQQQQVGLPQGQGMMQITPEQMARGYREQQGAPVAQFTPEELAEAYRQQQGSQGTQFTPEQIAAAVREAQGGPRAPTTVLQPGAVYPQAPPQYAQTQAQPQQAYAYPQAQAQPQQAYAYQQAPTQYAQPQAPAQYAQPQAPAQYAQPQAQQPYQYGQ